VFFDHFGPVIEQPGVNHDVRSHPQIGLATVTYLFEGAMMHRDSLGTEQLIEPGAINGMSAGSGIVHSERRPAQLQEQAYVNHGLQLWVALPQENEEDAPSFTHTPATQIPEVAVGGARVRVLLGAAFGQTAPVPTASPTLYLDVRLPAGAALDLVPLADEMALYPVAGDLLVDGQRLCVGTMAVLESAGAIRIEAGAGVPEGNEARFAVIGGTPLGARHIWWNFVSSRKERILQASADWEAQRMGRVPGETEFIPLPATRFTPPEPMS